MGKISMDPRRNPFAPGAGTPPPELAGRDEIIQAAKVALARVHQGRPGRSQLLLGLRGVGKTVLLNRLASAAEQEGFATIVFEAPEEHGLAEILVPPLRSTLIRLSRGAAARGAALRALAVLRSFASAFEVKFGDIEFGVKPETGSADSGHLVADLPELLLLVGQAAQRDGRGVAIFVDEVQYLSEEDLSALIVATHRLSQKELPFIVFGAGLPQIAALAGNAKSYAERLFRYAEVGRLAVAAAEDAIRAPIEREGAEIEAAALEMIVEKTQGYPYFLQEWGSHAWNVAERSPIVGADVDLATTQALQALDNEFFKVRFDRLTKRERDYVRAMGDLGPGPHRSGDIASRLGMEVTAAAPLRSGLIKKGMIYSPQHGDTAFTVPMFDEFIRRAMPQWTPPAVGPGGRGRRSKGHRS